MAKPALDPNHPLKNEKWEHFARLLSIGTAVAQAYEAAGFSPDAKNARKLAAKPEIEARVHALMVPVLERFSITRERWVREVAAIAFSDIGDLIEWDTETTTDVDNDDGGETLIIKHIHSHKGRFFSSKDLKPETRAAVQSVRVKPDGEIEIKLYNKLPALRLLGESMRLLGRHQRADEDDPAMPPAGERSAGEVVDELKALFNASLKEHEERSANARLIEGTATEEPG